VRGVAIITIKKRKKKQLCGGRLPRKTGGKNPQMGRTQKEKKPRCKNYGQKRKTKTIKTKDTRRHG